MDRQKTDIQVWFKSGIYTIVIRDLSFFLSLPLRTSSWKLQIFQSIVQFSTCSFFKALGYGYGLVLKAPAVQA